MMKCVCVLWKCVSDIWWQPCCVSMWTSCQNSKLSRRKHKWEEKKEWKRIWTKNAWVGDRNDDAFRQRMHLRVFESICSYNYKIRKSRILFLDLIQNYVTHFDTGHWETTHDDAQNQNHLLLSIDIFRIIIINVVAYRVGVLVSHMIVRLWKYKIPIPNKWEISIVTDAREYLVSDAHIYSRNQQNQIKFGYGKHDTSVEVTI